ncbi:DNA mismatch endonuclease (patch repair protein) [Xanthomonas arboricola]|uniref:very short patch repair endonuclease n=1 Tax=Xanthomonas campestris TaxID=339 RepID=UPI000E1E4CC5|nr:very short patch repair endonuclease [Xanthomonas campestris]MCW2003091.1 DNA mismatch endonuclease (patch repair protein) [Xanthomonas campestris]
MTDIVTPAQRSKMMSGIRGRDTKPEILVRKFLHQRGYRYRLNRRDLPGRPDIVLTKYKTAVFVNGCFWHAHKNCPYFKAPSTRTDFWEKKFLSNREHDISAINGLQNLGWRVATIWECALRKVAHQALLELINFLQGEECVADIRWNQPVSF